MPWKDAEVEMVNDRGESKTFFVSKIEAGKLTVDGNHPLAGKHLTFTLNILTIRDAIRFKPQVRLAICSAKTVKMLNSCH